MVLKPQLKQNKQRLKIMRKIIASEFMTIDGVIQNEENDGDGFRYGASFKVTESQISPNGIFIATYERDGDVKTAVFAD